jgi:hypothetical protein
VERLPLHSILKHMHQIALHWLQIVSCLTAQASRLRLCSNFIQTTKTQKRYHEPLHKSFFPCTSRPQTAGNHIVTQQKELPISGGAHKHGSPPYSMHGTHQKRDDRKAYR